MRNREIKSCTEFGIVSVSIFTLVENALISYINKTALQLINKKQEEVIGKHFGDSFNCTGSYKDKRGCGYGPLCIDCEIRKAISLAFESGQITDGLELNKQLLIDGKEADFWFKISVTPIIAEDKKNVVVSLSNITQKKKEELSILQSRDYFNNILNQIPAIVWKLNADLECEYVNMEWERFTGIKIEEALGNGLIQVLHPDDLDVCSRVIYEARKKRKSFQIEARLLRNDGEFRHCLVSGTPYYDLNGQFDGYIGTDLDITESKKAIESLNRYQNLAEITDDIILFIDLDGKIVDANKSAVKAYGYTYEELCSINIRDIRADWGYTKKQMEIANKTGIFFEAIHRRKDGSYFDVEVSSRGTDMDNSRILASIVRDVTERKLAVQNLKESERSKSVLLSNLPGMAYRCNYDKAWTMQFVSDGCFELTGYRPEDLLGNNKLSYNDLINSEYREYLWEKWTQLLPVKGVLKEEYMITTSTGEIKWVYEQARGIYDDNDNVIALEGLIIDITDRKKKEDEVLYLNYHDVLTGLYNRRFFEKKKKRIDIDSKLPLSVIIGDINGLKQVNDALGHAQGDKLLIAVSKVIKSCMRKQDILARTGGDDFSILLPNTSNEEANEIMKQTELACDEYNSNAIYHTSLSFGCATKTDLNEDINNILKLADDNMYQQKLLKKESFHSSVIASMKTSLLEKSQETEQHAQRLILLSKAIGMKLNLSDKQLNELEL